jgi:hypothetical protein
MSGLAEGLRARLGLPRTADANAILAATDKALDAADARKAAAATAPTARPTNPAEKSNAQLLDEVKATAAYRNWPL